MDFSVNTGALATSDTACLILGVFEQHKLSAAAQVVDDASGGHLGKLLQSGDLNGDAGQTLVLHGVPGLVANRVMLVDCGKAEELDRRVFDKVLKAVFARCAELGLTQATSTLAELPVAGMSFYQRQRAVAQAAAQSAYRYEHTKAKKPNARAPLAELALWVSPDASQAAAEQAAVHGRAIAAGANLARDLGNLPGNICTPSYLAEQAGGLADSADTFSVEVLDEAAMSELGMGALLSVARGSREPAKLIVMQHRGGQDGEKPVVLVGKGLTFDAGGISIKSAAEMDEMKYDMCGGAAVIGAMQAVRDLKLPLNVIGVVPASENLPDGAANKPGDIVTSMSGQTIEILNTDAEGRLILCDALTYCERFEPDVVIDMATLTGAVIVALGRHPSGLLANDDALAEALLAAGDAAGDRLWRLPLWKDYDSQLDSNFADMANIGGRDGGAITAAAFLAKFTKKFTWAHLDIAGTAWITGKEKGATGRPVPLLLEYLLRRCGQVSE
ncbi:leucyl aminopeptidase [Thiorhodovibrio frisius]|uniref:Probable cytosol aminopeptidase n=1 Tax=Thiorhodovibrio frisius TaxID=631362 RepID=H8Z3K2_9GAMM|nr:leucyl aminopeptidase [Thiorhodovibrio frisius]EIC21910.1 leucyl aminopeptidase [Thiorhodovibrio frisius]WPL24199.1 Cytosol aminopeptidase [Thiorhodovibrio frisius]